MAIQSIEDAKTLKKWCSKIGREGMALESYEIAKKIVSLYEDGECVDQMIEVGRMKALATGANSDTYFSEKIHHGFYKQVCKAEKL